MASIKITPVNVGDMRDKKNLLDADKGKYKLQLHITPKATREKSWPMLEIRCKLLQAYEPENEIYVGRQLSEYLFFPPRGEKSYIMQMRKLHALCDAAQVPVPDFSVIESWPDDGQAFIDSIDKAQIDGYVVLELDRETKKDRAVISFEAPRDYAASAPRGPSLDD